MQASREHNTSVLLEKTGYIHQSQLSLNTNVNQGRKKKRAKPPGIIDDETVRVVTKSNSEWMSLSLLSPPLHPISL